MNFKNDFRLLNLGIAFAVAAFCARADIITMNNSREMKGIIDEQGSDTKFVKFNNTQGSIKIPRDRIKSIKKEGAAEGWVHIGDEFKQQNKLADAMTSYQQALKADSSSALAQERIRGLQQTMAVKQKEERKDAISQIDQLKAQIDAMVRDGQFEQAENLLQKSSDLVPTDEQKAELQRIASNIYLAWGKDRQDKFDRPGAEDKYNLALAANPQNEEAIQNLLTLWEGQTDKQDKIFAVYETILERQPENQTVRRKLADLYYRANRLEDSAQQYLKLYKESEKSKGTDLEATLVENLNRLHMQFAGEKNYSKAIFFYKVLQGIVPKLGDQGLRYYEYMDKAQLVRGDDLDGHLELAKFAEANAMDSQALEQYRYVLTKDPANEAAKAGVDRYAMDLIRQAREAFNRTDYYLSKALSDRVTSDFAGSEQAIVSANEIIGASNNELQRMARQARAACQGYIERGDTYYNQAIVFYRDFFDTTRSSTTTPVSSPRRDALRYFGYAIQMYQEALKLCPNLANDPTAMVGPNLAEAQRYLSQLNAPLPPLRGNYGRISDPSYNSPVNDPTGRRR